MSVHGQAWQSMVRVWHGDSTQPEIMGRIRKLEL